MRAHMWSFVLILLVAFTVVAAPTASVQGECVEGLIEDAAYYTNDSTTFCEVTASALCGVFGPLLSPWAAALLISVLVFVGFVFLRRKSRVANALTSVILLFTVLVTSFYITAWTVQAHTIETNSPTPILHVHRPRYGERDLRPGEKDCIDGMVGYAYPKAEQVGPATISYNGHGYAFDGGISWIDPSQVPIMLNWDYDQVYEDTLKVNDVIAYNNGVGTPYLGSGLVAVVTEGVVDTVESKWGIAGRYRHEPDYGPHYNAAQTITYWRRKP